MSKSDGDLEGFILCSLMMCTSDDASIHVVRLSIRLFSKYIYIPSVDCIIVIAIRLHAINELTKEKCWSRHIISLDRFTLAYFFFYLFNSLIACKVYVGLID